MGLYMGLYRWGCMGLCRAIWGCVGLYGAIWGYMGLYGAIWGYMELHRAIWGYVGHLECIALRVDGLRKMCENILFVRGN